MDLHYNILWFENSDSWYEEIKESIEELLEEHAYNVEITRRKDDLTLDADLVANDYNLILMDYNLDNVKGDEIIEKIRATKNYVTVVFYSTDGTEALRQAIIGKEGLDGVYCASRATFDHELEQVINITLKQVETVNNLRGLIMAKTSDMDDLIIDILQDFFKESSNDELKKELKKDICQSVTKSLEEYHTEFTAFCEKDDISSMLTNPSFGAQKKAIAISKLLEPLELPKSSKQFNREYNNDVIKNRNILAHVKEDINEQGQRVLKSKVSKVEPMIFDSELCKETRKKLTYHENFLFEIKERLDDSIVIGKLIATGKEKEAYKMCIEQGFIKPLEHLTELHLMFLDIKEIHPNIKKLRNLRVLNLAHNSIYNIPSEIGTLRNLEFLYLNNNDLNIIPERVRRMSKLSRLHLAKNEFDIDAKNQIKTLLPNTDIIF